MTMTSRSRPPLMTLTTTVQIRAIASPARLELVGFLVALGPCSVAELAEATDRPADALYRHVRVLLKAGVAVEVGHRRAGKRREVVLDAAADHFYLDYDPATRRNSAAHGKVARAVLRETESALRAVDGAADVAVAGPGKNLLLRLDMAWLDDRDREQAVRTLEELQGLFARNRRRGPGKRLFLMTGVLAPVVRRRHAKVRSAASAERGGREP